MRSPADDRIGQSPRWLSMVGRVVGSIAALGAVALWAVFLFGNPYDPPAGGRLLLFGSLMILASTVSAIAAAFGAHLAMYLLFFACFFPVGLYVLIFPGLFRSIGLLNLLYLVSAMLVHRAILDGKKKEARRGLTPES
jgi:hypothetical protein